MFLPKQHWTMSAQFVTLLDPDLGMQKVWFPSTVFVWFRCKAESSKNTSAFRRISLGMYCWKKHVKFNFVKCFPQIPTCHPQVQTPFHRPFGRSLKKKKNTFHPGWAKAEIDQPRYLLSSNHVDCTAEVYQKKHPKGSCQCSAVDVGKVPAFRQQQIERCHCGSTYPLKSVLS